MSAGSEAPPAGPKVDPETLAIRARPRRAMRFRRGVIIGGTAASVAGLMGVAWLALQPPSFRATPQESELSQPDNRPSTEALGNLPSNYDQVPKLGPPLPGDLGRPILRAQQREMATEISSPHSIADPGRSTRDRAAADRKSALESGLLFQTSSRASSREGPSSDAQKGGPASEGAVPQGLDRKGQFVATVDRGGDTNPNRLSPAMSPHTLLAGSVVAASLITGLDSDLPGIVTAQVTQNAYDSATGRTLLVPQGARLIGNYDHVVAFGQQRALVVWQRLVMPDGSSIRLENEPASDPSGYAGLADKVDFHTWRLLKGVAIATLLGVGTELSISGESDLVEAIRESGQTNAARAGDQITQRNLSIPPTIRIRPGASVRLVVHRDLVLAPWRSGGR